MNSELDSDLALDRQLRALSAADGLVKQLITLTVAVVTFVLTQLPSSGLLAAGTVVLLLSVAAGLLILSRFIGLLGSRNVEIEDLKAFSPFTLVVGLIQVSLIAIGLILFTFAPRAVEAGEGSCVIQAPAIGSCEIVAE